MKKAFLLCLLYCFLPANAQINWHNPMNAGMPTVQNQGWTNEIGHTYTRLPERAKQSVREAVWNLSRNSAGLAIHFYTNTPEIRVRYAVSERTSMLHMPATGVSGIDLYSIDSDGNWNRCAGGYTFNDTIQYTFSNIPKNRQHNNGYEYRLFLPLYNTVKWLEIGVDETAEFTFVPLSPEKPILLYGTSIAHGACASRPGMAWSNILQRSLDYPLINLGFSGNGRLEKEVIDLIAETDARLYILDCLPNVDGREEAELIPLIVNAVKQIRRQRAAAPILLVEHIGYANGATNSKLLESYTRANRANRKAYEQLLNENIGNLYYLTREELNIPADGWVDHIHPNDLGMQAQATAVEAKIREILKLPVGDLATTRPVTQRREPYKYEWKKRHNEILTRHRQNPPRSVIIGNSITHFWGGEPLDTEKSGIDSWNAHMQPAGFQNMGYGWDRIENVLWRIYHDELDGFEAEKVVLMIGTNNFGRDTDDSIIEGLRFLLAAIRERQPQAEIKLIGILPRRNAEEWVKNINYRIQEIAIRDNYNFQDPGGALLQPDGKINETLFSDGLHPNAQGYQLIVRTIVD
ncbi:SGNH/GDSL hydrolase family protein [Parabacteroides sp. OttesenSCG-928-G07]|nr:SGNH/GDSL hydrolase family protein [Parabacteroides sp. OttesenSCG-928-G21]MDL2277248.1 SGNH/GDSL hydrolase family protein [Parabacteroides sp. OttesenSCG-928-G07]